MTVFWDRVAASLLLAFAVYTMAAARDMAFMQGRTPGPGFAPFWIGVGLGLASISILWRSLRARSPAAEAAANPAGAGAARSQPALLLLAITAATVVAVLLIQPFGMIAPLALLLLVLARMFGAAWRTAATAAVALSLIVYVLFSLMLGVPLPRGPWGF